LEYRWPESSDRLLRSSDGWDRTVTFTDRPSSRHAFIWSGYMRAGRALIEACECEPSDRHGLIYPILFSYRHGIEMAMKWIVTHYGRYVGVPWPETNHNLWQLWQSCKTVIVEIGGDSEAVGIVEKLVKELHDLDKSALAFRYSMDKNRVLIPLPEVPLDLDNLRDVMLGVDNFFVGADAQLDDYVSSAPW
jgi:hypothetical protein